MGSEGNSTAVRGFWRGILLEQLSIVRRDPLPNRRQARSDGGELLDAAKESSERNGTGRGWSNSVEELPQIALDC